MSARHEKKDGQYALKEACEERHAAGRWVFRVLIGLTALFLTAAIYAVDTANQACDQTHEMRTTIHSHLSAQVETNSHIRQRLDEIRVDIRENRNLLNSLLRSRQTSTKHK
jgi:hypothetical protein